MQQRTSSCGHEEKGRTLVGRLKWWVYTNAQFLLQNWVPAPINAREVYVFRSPIQMGS